jgi:hypothetical protein
MWYIKPFRRHLFRRKVYATLSLFIPQSGLNTVHILQRREIFTLDVHDDNEKFIDDLKSAFIHVLLHKN